MDAEREASPMDPAHTARDREWCVALVNSLDAREINRVVEFFNRHRSDGGKPINERTLIDASGVQPRVERELDRWSGFPIGHWFAIRGAIQRGETPPLESFDACSAWFEANRPQRAGVERATPDESIRACVSILLEPVLRLLQKDPHQWSKRPCATCSSVSSIVGYSFGCVRNSEEAALLRSLATPNAQEAPRG